MEDIEKGMKAKEILDNPVYRQVMLELKGDLFSEFSRETVWDGKKKREKIWDMMQAVNKFEEKLTDALTDAVIASNELGRKERMKRVK